MRCSTYFFIFSPEWSRIVYIVYVSGAYVEWFGDDGLVVVEHAVEGAIYSVVDEVHRVRLRAAVHVLRRYLHT